MFTARTVATSAKRSQWPVSQFAGGLVLLGAGEPAAHRQCRLAITREGLYK